MNIEEKYLKESNENYTSVEEFGNIDFNLVECCATCVYYDNYNVELCINKDVKKAGERYGFNGYFTTVANGSCRYYKQKRKY